MPPASPVESLTDRGVARTLIGACGETGGMYDCEGAIDPWGVAICDPSEWYGYDVIMRV